MRDPLAVHWSAEELLHTPGHIHCVVQIKVPIVVKDRVRASREKRKDEGKGNDEQQRPTQAPNPTR